MIGIEGQDDGMPKRVGFERRSDFYGTLSNLYQLGAFGEYGGSRVPPTSIVAAEQAAMRTTGKMMFLGCTCLYS